MAPLGGSRCRLCQFSATAHGPEWGRARGSAIVNKYVVDDVAVTLGHLGCGMGVRGVSWVWQGGVGGVLDLCLEFWGEKNCSIE